MKPRSEPQPACDRDAEIGAFYGRHHQLMARTIRGIVRRADAVDDVMQDVSVKLLLMSARLSFDNEAGWAYVIARNAALSWVERERRIRAHEIIGVEAVANAAGAPSDAEGKLEVAEIAAALGPRDRELLNAFLETGKAVDAAKRVGRPAATVRRRLREIGDLVTGWFSP